MTGGDTEEMATMWFVYSRMSPNKHPTIRAPITLEMDKESPDRACPRRRDL
jgi:hypothetical protein